MNTDRAERVAWIQLRHTPNVGPVRLLHLIRAFGSAQSVLQQSAQDLQQAGVSPAVAEAIRQNSTSEVSRQQAEAELDKAARQGIQVVLYSDSDYPVNLKSIYAPPPYLYVRGRLEPKDRLGVAIVGTRRASRDGLHMAEQLAAGLAQRGLTIVSGFARGIDSVAHRAALAAGGRTLAVLGNGLEHCYPGENRELFEQVPKQGALLSELPLDAPPEPKHFPPRNRIIAGLCIGVVVVEAPMKSGALISARAAMEQNRDVFAVPGRVRGGYSSGCHQLIKEGAALVENEWDVLQALSGEIDRLSGEIGLAEAEEGIAQRPAVPAALELPSRQPPVERPVLSSEEEQLWQVLQATPTHIDWISRRSGMEIAQVSRILMGLQLKQLVGQNAGMQFYRIVSH